MGKTNSYSIKPKLDIIEINRLHTFYFNLKLSENDLQVFQKIILNKYLIKSTAYSDLESEKENSGIDRFLNTVDIAHRESLEFDIYNHKKNIDHATALVKSIKTSILTYKKIGFELSLINACQNIGFLVSRGSNVKVNKLTTNTDINTIEEAHKFENILTKALEEIENEIKDLRSINTKKILITRFVEHLVSTLFFEFRILPSQNLVLFYCDRLFINYSFETASKAYKISSKRFKGSGNDMLNLFDEMINDYKNWVT